MVRTIESAEAATAGDQKVIWNGLDDYGNQVPDGEYIYDIRAVGVDGLNFSGTPYLEGVVTSVGFSADGTAYLLTGDHEFKVGNVVEVSGG